MPLTKVYTNDAFGYSINYPSEWTVEEQGNQVLIHHDLGTSAVITAKPVPAGVSLEEYVDFDEAGFIRAVPSYEETSRTKIDEPPSYLTEGTFSAEGVPGLVKGLITLNGDYSIAAGFFVSEFLAGIHQPILDRMLASLRIFAPSRVSVREYREDRIGFAISYPGSWTIDDSDPTFIDLNPGFSSFVVVSGIMVGPITLETYVSQFLEVYTERFGAREVSRTAIEGEVPGILIRFEWSFANSPILSDLIVKVEGARVFFVFASALKGSFAPHEEDFQRLIDSFEITLDPATESLGADLGADELLDAIGERVTGIRGLPALAALDRKIQTREEFQQENVFVDEESEREFEVLKDFCLVMDLCAPSDDLLLAFEDITGEGVLGYYEPDDKSFTTIVDGDTLDPEAWLTYAHEYTHALQDQQFNLSSLEPEEDTFDSSKAIAALVEGDARLTEYLFYETLPATQQADLARSREESLEEFLGSPQVTEAPRIITETFGWEHGAGLGFVFRLYREGGFEAIDQAYNNPPHSTEQILHPEKYLSGEAPHTVELPENLVAAPGVGWQERDAGILGEFLTEIYLATFIPEDQAESAAEGWDGDRYALFKDDQGSLVMAMRFSWDTVEDADEFFQAYLDFVAAKSQGEWELVETDTNLRLWVGEDISVFLGFAGGDSVVVIGPDRSTVEDVVAQIVAFSLGE